MTKSLKAEIFGRVQGVGFRIFVKSNADKLGLVGKVSNSNHGTVEVIACGEEEKLNEFLLILKKGPLIAKIDKVEYSFGYPTEEFSEFSVVRDEGGIVVDQKKAFGNFLRKFLRF